MNDDERRLLDLIGQVTGYSFDHRKKNIRVTLVFPITAEADRAVRSSIGPIDRITTANRARDAAPLFAEEERG